MVALETSPFLFVCCVAWPFNHTLVKIVYTYIQNYSENWRRLWLRLTRMRSRLLAKSAIYLYLSRSESFGNRYIIWKSSNFMLQDIIVQYPLSDSLNAYKRLLYLKSMVAGTLNFQCFLKTTLSFLHNDNYYYSVSLVSIKI